MCIHTNISTKKVHVDPHQNPIISARFPRHHPMNCTDRKLHGERLQKRRKDWKSAQAVKI